MNQVTLSPPNFNFIARPYRWLEYLALGRKLERCRLHFLPQLKNRSRALVLGDGDGRFLSALLTQNLDLQAVAVDTSAAMLQQLEIRCEHLTLRSRHRLQTHQADALSFLEASCGGSYDLIVTHFFLDCLSQPQVDALADMVLPKLAPNALWLISDFCIPTGPMRLPATVFVRSLYLGFRILTGLRTTRLPDYAAALTRTGFVRVACHRSFLGILVTELWSHHASAGYCGAGVVGLVAPGDPPSDGLPLVGPLAPVPLPAPGVLLEPEAEPKPPLEVAIPPPKMLDLE